MTKQNPIINNELFRSKVLKSMINKLQSKGIKKPKKVISVLLENIKFNEPINLKSNKLSLFYDTNKDLLFLFTMSLDVVQFQLYNLLCGKAACHHGKKKLNHKSQIDKIKPVLAKICNVLSIDVIHHHGYYLLNNQSFTPITIDVNSPLMLYWVALQNPTLDDKNYHSHSEFNGFIINNFYSNNENHCRIYNFLSFRSSESRVNFLKKLNQGNDIYEIDLVSSVPQAIAKLAKANTIIDKIKHHSLIIEDDETYSNITIQCSNIFHNEDLNHQLHKLEDSRSKLKLLLNSAIFSLTSKKQVWLNVKIIEMILSSRGVSESDIRAFLDCIATLQDIDILFKIEHPLREESLYKQGVNVHDAIYLPTIERVQEVQTVLDMMDLIYKVTKH